MINAASKTNGVSFENRGYNTEVIHTDSNQDYNSSNE